MFCQAQLKNNNAPEQTGGSLVEIVVVSGIIMGSLAAILGLASFFLATSQLAQQTSQASALAQEVMEVARNYRDGTDWAVNGLGSPSIAVDTEYHPIISAGEWHFVSDPETIGEFTRSVVFSNVCRDGSDNIAACPASYTDGDSKKATVTVFWEERGRSHQVGLAAYFTNWKQ